MEMIISDNEAGREAIRKAAADIGVSVTKLGDLAGTSTGSLMRFVSNRARVDPRTRRGTGFLEETNCHLATFLRALDAAGYEVVVRPKVTGSRRERRLKAMRERANGQEAPSS